ncbi:2,3-bisphosphoglycerate-independent phosphoglycerate mutase [Halovenus rubra]|uniref:2,3-bisphosphoglycerate-independent phosphoglycerate mutase n=2 Tax=Halovenus rubra TaxID=869890 RepID=A0ABD5XCR2_9EURY|nr:2,3-bisphosphoglycerate-independent phosphoglycerate mutase [Halovenus rubra]
MDVGLVILDGWGLNPDSNTRDAVAAAETPTVDDLRQRGATTTLETDGRRVGLPTGQMGNSEVGHLNIGAGRVVTQESARITDAIARWRGETSTFDAPADPPLDENDAIQSAFEYANDNGGRVHLLGLLSDGGVHSYQSHIQALIDLASEHGVEAVTHAFTDGRDTSPTGGKQYLRKLESYTADAGTGRVGTVCGRYHAMDRDENWDRTKHAYDAIVNRKAAHTAPSAVTAIEQSYERGVTDEFVEPTLVEGRPSVQAEDSVIFVNFRADRARQLTRLLGNIEPVWSFETSPPEACFVTMTEYDSNFELPIAFPAIQPEQTLGEVLADAGRTQLRIAETEKYAHVTYFLNGGREVEFQGERREIVQSPDVPTYDERPAMSAAGVTSRAIEVIDDDNPDVVVLNYANPDMIGHTGDFEAAVTAVEAVDTQLARLVDAMQAAGADVLVTADHGNADEMGTTENPHTAHTTNPVPFVYVSDANDNGDRNVRDGGALEDIAPTVLDLLSLAKPPEMTGESLLE